MRKFTQQNYTIWTQQFTREGGGVKKKREDVSGGQGRGEREERGDGRCWERREGLSWLGEKRDVREIAGEGGREC